MSPSSTERTPCAHGMPSKGACVECMYDEGLGGEPVEPLTLIGSPFPAQFPGDCPGCNLPIYKGEPIARRSDDRYVHEGCAP